MAKPWEKIFDIFGSVFSRDLSQELPSPDSLSGAGIGRADSVGSSEYLEGGSTFNHTVEINSLNDFLEIGEHTDRRARYLEYDRMENIPEISSSLDTYADECTIPDTDRNVFEVQTKHQGIKEECDWLFRDLLKIDTHNLWSWFRDLCKNGDLFLELVINTENPEFGVQKVAELPPETVYRIETVRGKLLEFQQSYQGPDYQSILMDLKAKKDVAAQSVAYLGASHASVTTTGGELHSQVSMNKLANTVIRFNPEQIVHARIGNRRRGFYPYGVSILYAARRISHLLKLMEDSMVVYRLSRAPERRVFYIDIGTLPPHKGELALERMKDQLKKKKIYNRRSDQIDERYNAWAADEDFFIPTRPESNTRIETLPGGCLAMDTLIPLMDGRVLTLKEMKKEYQDGKINWIYSCNPKNGEIVPGLVSWAGTTHEKAKVMKLVFDNGKELVCTPDHKFPTLADGKKRADEFKIGDRIIPFYNKKDEIYDNKTKSWISKKFIASKIIKEKLEEDVFYDHWMMNRFIDSYKKNNFDLYKTSLDLFSDDKFFDHFCEFNCQNSDFNLIKILNKYGYENASHLRNDIDFYNHKIIKIEELEEEIEVGTLTIDQDEIFHNYHTFALDSIGFTYNSHMSEIDDTKYFREKLMVALKLPKNYLFQDDVSITRTSFVAQDMRFARTIYRIQKIMSHALSEIAKRHLVLKGYTENDIRGLSVLFTSPSDWMELSRSEIINSRYNLAGSIKGAQLYDHHTILTKILKHTDEEAQRIIDNLEKETLRQQEIQAQAQIFAQLATPEPEGPPQDALGMGGMGGMGGGIPNISGETPSPIPQQSSEETPEMEFPEEETETSREKITDFSDLESDEEEIDINYE